MSYNANIPLATDKLSKSQGDILANFQAANAYFSRNHIAFATNNTALNGKHTFVEMTNSISNVKPNPSPALAAQSGTIYTKRNANLSDLFYTNDASGNEYQLTDIAKDATDFGFLAKNIAPTVSGGIGTTGWTWIGQSMIIQYGTVPHTSAATTTVKFQLTFASVPFLIQTTGIVLSDADANQRGSCPVVDGSVTTTEFRFRSTSNSALTNVYWMAIGVY